MHEDDDLTYRGDWGTNHARGCRISERDLCRVPSECECRWVQKLQQGRHRPIASKDCGRTGDCSRWRVDVLRGLPLQHAGQDLGEARGYLQAHAGRPEEGVTGDVLDFEGGAMNRRSFVSNLVAGFSALMAIYSAPISRVSKPVKWDGIPFKPDPFPRRFNYLGNEVFTESKWIVLIKRGPWPKGMGDTIRTVTYERCAPNGDMTPSWSNNIQDA